MNTTSEHAEARGGPITETRPLIEYMEAGCKAPGDWRIGTEHEKFAYDLDTLRPLDYEGGIRFTFQWYGPLERTGDAARSATPRPEERAPDRGPDTEGQGFFAFHAIRVHPLGTRVPIRHLPRVRCLGMGRHRFGGRLRYADEHRERRQSRDREYLPLRHVPSPVLGRGVVSRHAVSRGARRPFASPTTSAVPPHRCHGTARKSGRRGGAGSVCSEGPGREDNSG